MHSLNSEFTSGPTPMSPMNLGQDILNVDTSQGNTSQTARTRKYDRAVVIDLSQCELVKKMLQKSYFYFVLWLGFINGNMNVERNFLLYKCDLIISLFISPLLASYAWPI